MCSLQSQVSFVFNTLQYRIFHFFVDWLKLIYNIESSCNKMWQLKYNELWSNVKTSFIIWFFFYVIFVWGCCWEPDRRWVLWNGRGAPGQHPLLVKDSNRTTISRQSPKQQKSPKVCNNPENIARFVAFNEKVVKSPALFWLLGKFSQPLPFLGKTYRKLCKRQRLLFLCSHVICRRFHKYL